MARTVHARGSFGKRGLRASGVPPRTVALTRSLVSASMRPLISHRVRLSVSPCWKSARPLVRVLTITFFASAVRFSRFIASSGANIFRT